MSWEAVKEFLRPNRWKLIMPISLGLFLVFFEFPMTEFEFLAALAVFSGGPLGLPSIFGLLSLRLSGHFLLYLFAIPVNLAAMYVVNSFGFRLWRSSRGVAIGVTVLYYAISAKS